MESSYPKKEVGYEPTGSVMGLGFCSITYDQTAPTPARNPTPP